MGNVDWTGDSDEALELSRLSLPGAKKMAGHVLGDVKEYFQVRGGKRVKVRSHKRNFDPALDRGLQGRPPTAAKPGIFPQGRSTPSSFPVQQAEHAQKQVQGKARQVVEGIRDNPQLTAALRNNILGDKNLVNGMSGDQARSLVDDMMTGGKGSPYGALDTLEEMVGPENVPNLQPRRPAPPQAAQPAFQEAPPSRPLWHFQDLPGEVPRSERATGMSARHPQLGLGKVTGYDSNGNVQMQFVNDPKTYSVPTGELTPVQEIGKWEDVAPLRPGDTHAGKIVRGSDGKIGKVKRAALAPGSSYVETADGVPEVWWDKDLTEVRSGGPGVRGGRSKPPQRDVVNPATGDIVKIDGDLRPPQGYIEMPGQSFDPSAMTELPDVLDRGPDGGGPGSSAPDWPGLYYPSSAQSWGGPQKEPKTWIGEDGHEYGIESRVNPINGSHQSALVDYGIPGQREPYHRPRKVRDANAFEAATGRPGLFDIPDDYDLPQRPPGDPGTGRPRPRRPRPPGQPGAKPQPEGKKPRGPSRPEHDVPTIFQPPAPVDSPEGIAQRQREMFAVERGLFRGKPTREQQTMARQILMSKSPSAMTAEERQFMKDVYGRDWQKHQARMQKWFPNVFDRAAKARQQRSGLSPIGRAMAVVAITSRQGGMTDEEFDEFLESPQGARTKARLEKGFGKDWRRVREKLRELPEAARPAMAERTLDEIQRTNWGSEKEAAQQQLARLQDIFGAENVHVDDIDHPTVQRRLMDFSMMDDRHLRAVADYWDRERLRSGNPDFGQIHMGHKPLSQLNDFANIAARAGKDPTFMDDRAGVHMPSHGLVIVGTEDTSSPSASIHEFSHALDAAMGFHSRNKDFQATAERVRRVMGGAIDPYFSSDGDWTSEMFAEANAAMTVGWERGHRGEDLYRYIAGALSGGRGDPARLSAAGRLLYEAMSRVSDGVGSDSRYGMGRNRTPGSAVGQGAEGATTRPGTAFLPHGDPEAVVADIVREFEEQAKELGLDLPQGRPNRPGQPGWQMPEFEPPDVTAEEMQSWSDEDLRRIARAGPGVYPAEHQRRARAELARRVMEQFPRPMPGGRPGRGPDGLPEQFLQPGAESLRPGLIRGPSEPVQRMQGAPAFQGAPALPQQPDRKPRTGRVQNPRNPNRRVSSELVPADPETIQRRTEDHIQHTQSVIDRMEKERTETLRADVQAADAAVDRAEGALKAARGAMVPIPANIAYLEERLQEVRQDREQAQQVLDTLPERAEAFRRRIMDALSRDREEGTHLTDGVNLYSVSPSVEDHESFRREFLEPTARELQRIMENAPPTIQRDDPYHRPYWVRYAPGSEEAAPNRNAYGWAVRGTPQITMNTDTMTDFVRADRRGTPHPASFQENPGHYVPEAADVSALQYVLTHEFGHTIDQASGRGGLDDEQLAELYAQLNDGNMLSGYSRSTQAEMVADAFVMWMLGDRSNPMVRKIASIMGWDQEYVPPPTVEPPEEAMWFSARQRREAVDA